VDFHEASSVGRARTLLAAQTYDGLVLDLHEEQQALELLGELRLGRFATARDARVVVLAADAKPDAATRVQALGATCVLNKPVRISDLLTMLVAAQAC
jgi:CheY-like chemotaxis protein